MRAAALEQLMLQEPSSRSRDAEEGGRYCARIARCPHIAVTTAIDSDGAHGGDKRHDILDDRCFDSLLRRVQRGEFVAIFAAPPCSTFSISRFIRSKASKDGGPPAIRLRSLGDRQVTGSDKCCPEKHRRELSAANKIVSRMCTILKAAAEVGTEFAVENPADRSGVSRPDLFLHPEHAPIWLMPEMQELSSFAS